MLEVLAGDIVLVHTQSFIGQAIRYLTRDKGESPTRYNHAALVIKGSKYPSDIRVIEAIDTGIKIRPLSDSAWRREKKTLSIWRDPGLYINQMELLKRALDYLNKPYPYMDLALHALDWAISRLTLNRDLFVCRAFGGHVPVCSELVSRMLLYNFGRFAPDQVTPDDIHDDLLRHAKCIIAETTYEKLVENEWERGS